MNPPELPDPLGSAAHEPAPPQPLATPARRRLLLAGAGLAAASVGVGLALWRENEALPRVDDVVAGFWQLHWESPTGTEVRMETFRGQPVLINFWATWCPPCVEELPLINTYFQQNKEKGRQVLGLAVDKRSAVESFLQKQPLDFPVAVGGLGGAELSRALGNPSGALPFSVLIGAGGALLQRKLGRLNEADLQGWAQLK